MGLALFFIAGTLLPLLSHDHWTVRFFDPRIGREVCNTFHAEHPFFRYPLDHAFHSEHFKLDDPPSTDR